MARTGEELGEKLRILVGKPGLDGHSNGAEQVAVRARDAGFEVVYQGIRLTPEQIVAAAVAEDVHLVGLSILSGSHMELVPEVLRGLREAGAGDVPVIVGGIIPESDAAALRAAGVAMVFTPKDFGLNDIMGEMVGVIRAARGSCAARVRARLSRRSVAGMSDLQCAARVIVVNPPALSRRRVARVGDPPREGPGGVCRRRRPRHRPGRVAGRRPRGPLAPRSR